MQHQPEQPEQPEQPAIAATETVAATWGRPLHPVGCVECGQAHLVEQAWVGQVCPACARGTLEPQPALLRSEPPELLLPFRTQRPDLAAILKAFVKPVWLRPDDFTVSAMLQRVVPVYWPMWLVDGNVVGSWEADMGYDYQVKSSQESYGDNGWQSHEVLETRVRWQPRAGQLVRHYDNVAVPAMEYQQRLLHLVGAYQRDAAVPYSPEHVAGAALRVPDIQPESAWPMAQSGLDRVAGNDCQQAAAAQHMRNFAIAASYESLHWTQLLHPLYVTWYTDEQGTPQIVYINGQSGTAGGVRLAAVRKGLKLAGLIALVAVVLLLVGIVLVALRSFAPELETAGVLVGVLAVLVGVGGAVVALWPWQWNQRQRELHPNTGTDTRTGPQT